ncbi:MAG TPA: hypothetical protein VF236_07470 [Gaiellaceae bacterium]
MHSARVALLTGAALLALAVTAVASGMRPPPLEDGTLSVRDGRATILLRMNGGVIGRFARGKLTVTESPGGGTTVVVRGGKRPKFINARTTVYSGANIRFRIADDRRVVVRIHGSKINFSAVGRGEAWLDGWGNPALGVYFDGSYSLNGDNYRSLPDQRARVELAAVPTAP